MVDKGSTFIMRVTLCSLQLCHRLEWFRNRLPQHSLCKLILTLAQYQYYALCQGTRIQSKWLTKFVRNNARSSLCVLTFCVSHSVGKPSGRKTRYFIILLMAYRQTKAYAKANFFVFIYLLDYLSSTDLFNGFYKNNTFYLFINLNHKTLILIQTLLTSLTSLMVKYKGITSWMKHIMTKRSSIFRNLF